jgi:hypothetical protein
MARRAEQNQKIPSRIWRSCEIPSRKNLKGSIQRSRIESKALQKITLALWIAQRGQKSQKTSAAQETVNSGDTYLEKMKTRKGFSSWSKENKPRRK